MWNVVNVDEYSLSDAEMMNGIVYQRQEGDVYVTPVNNLGKGARSILILSGERVGNIYQFGGPHKYRKVSDTINVSW